MKRTRLDRAKDFDEFYRDSKKIFTSLRDVDFRAIEFERVYMLCICPGSRAGGNNKKVVEIFWGASNFDVEKDGKNWKSRTERGATLHFEMDDNGFVIITLHPAQTENRMPVEKFITLHIWLDPKKMKSKGFVKGLWRDFMAYMEYTSLDGNPTLWQRLRISYLRFFKHLNVDGVWRPSKFSETCKDVGKWVMTVGFSGVIVYLVTVFTQPSISGTEKHLHKVNEKLDNISRQIEYFQKIIKVDHSLPQDSTNRHEGS